MTFSDKQVFHTEGILLVFDMMKNMPENSDINSRLLLRAHIY